MLAVHRLVCLPPCRCRGASLSSAAFCRHDRTAPMLQQMRAVSKSWVSSVFLGMLALSFGVWGVADIFRGGGGDTSLVSVGDAKIQGPDFQRDFRTALRNA